MEPDDEVTMLTLPSDDAVAAAGNTFSISIDPIELPLEYVEADGLVTIDIIIAVPGAGLIGATMVTVALIDDAGVGPRWVDPLAIDEATGQLISNSAEPVDVGIQVHLEPASEEVQEWIPSVGSPTSCTYVSRLEQSSDRWATIGSTYPLYSTVARMEISSTRSHSTTFGSALSYNNSSWRAEGSVTKSSSFGQVFSNSGSFRSYQVNVRYGRYKVYDPFNLYCGKYYFWKARYETGYTKTTNLSGMPNYSNCGPVATGTWWRSASDGYAYSNSGGAKIASIIGFDLKTKSQYNLSKKLAYLIASSGHKLCGNETVPSRASKIHDLTW